MTSTTPSAAVPSNGMKQTPLTCHGHTRPVVHLNFSGITPNGYFLISACKDGKPMLRQGETGDWIGTFEGHKGAVWGCALTRDASRAATGAADFAAKVWSCETGDEVSSIGHSHIVRSVDFSNDNRLLLTGSNEKLVKVFDLSSPGQPVISWKGHTAAIRHALFLDNQVISASDDKTIRLWDKKRGSDDSIQKIDLDSIPVSIEVSPDGSILSVCAGQTVSFWSLHTLDKIKEYKTPTQILSATLHPNKSVFVCGGDDFKMYKYDYEDGTEKESFKGHFGPVHCVRFSPDGEIYASGSEDGTVRLWQNVIGKNYGLWKCVFPGEGEAQNNNNGLQQSNGGGEEGDTNHSYN